ncbi:MAG: DUF2752 domain-containing protein [Saonia sp.]
MQLTTLLLIAEDLMLPCLSKRILGVDCPGCGLQRSVAFLFQGDFVAAFKMYPAIYTIILLFAFLSVDYFFKIKHANKIVITLMISSIVLILANFILKFY